MASRQGKPVYANTPLNPGDSVHIEWQGSWFPGEVVRLDADGNVQIHYEGWDSSWDEVVPRSRLRIGGPGKTTASAGAAMAQAPPPPLDPWASFIASQPVTASTSLERGDRVHVEWQGVWWPGEVLEVQVEDRVKIHYRGWASNWDEVVPRERLRLQAAPGTNVITLHLERDWTVTGAFVEADRDFVTILRAGDHKPIAVCKSRIAYIENANLGTRKAPRS